MASKEQLKKLIKQIREVTGKTQQEVALGANYEPKTLTQIISGKADKAPAYERLKMAYKEELKKSTTQKNEVDEDIIAYSLKTLTDSHKILVETHREAISTNRRLGLLLEINLGASAEVSRLLKEEASRQPGPVVYIRGSLDKEEIHLTEKKKV